MSLSADTLLLQLQEANRKLALLKKVTEELNKVSNLHNKLRNILSILKDQFNIQYSILFLPDRSGEYLSVMASYGYDTDLSGNKVEVGKGIVGLAAQKRRPINITGIRRKKQYLQLAAHAEPESAEIPPGLETPESQIAIPLVANDELVAVLLAESYNLSVFKMADEQFLITLAQPIAVSIQNSMLFDSMEEKIAERTSELQRSNETKDRLFSIISHDLRGPITSFQNVAGLIHYYNKKGEPDKIERLGKRIDHAATQVNYLLDNLLNWSLSQTNEIICNPVDIRIYDLLTQTSEIYRESMLSKELSFELSIDTCHAVRGDLHMLSTVFRNLLSNAIKYTPRAGAIRITATRIDHSIHIQVVDNGTGIPEHKISRLFEADRHKTTYGTENEKGTGLGLMLTKEFLTVNNGSISVDSREGDGTTVTVVLPAV